MLKEIVKQKTEENKEYLLDLLFKLRWYLNFACDNILPIRDKYRGLRLCLKRSILLFQLSLLELHYQSHTHTDNGYGLSIPDGVIGGL